MVKLPNIVLEVPRRSMKPQRLLIILLRKLSVLQDLRSEYCEKHHISNITEATGDAV